MLDTTKLDFLSDILKKCHVPLNIVSPSEPAKTLFNAGLMNIAGDRYDLTLSVGQYFGRIEPLTKYIFVDSFRQCHICIHFPTSDEKNLMFIGPYLSSPLTQSELLELGETIGLKPNLQKYFDEYYSSIPVVPENDRLFAVIDTFCEHIWHTHSFAIADVSKINTLPVSTMGERSKNDTYDDITAQTNIMETRYLFENELIEAVMLGQQHKEDLLLSTLGEYSFENRLKDPVRNVKNYSIIMNTLLRKAAEQGGVHPIYIDRISSSFAEKIENIISAKEAPGLMKDMFSSYCRLVYKHSTKKYSPLVQKAILIIDSDLSAELSLNLIAKHLSVSPGYLATVFKKDTKKTLSEYIRERRIRYAAYLLRTTNLQVQTIAVHCGIMDTQYFSKMFKRQMDKTPKQYRSESHN